MTDAAPADTGQAPAAPTGPSFRVLAQYVRDLSFENPRAPESLRIDGRPAIDMGVEMGAQGRGDGLFEVDIKLSIKATSKQNDQEIGVFQVELVYGGLFELSGVSEDQVEPMLLVECPRYLFPFARQIIGNATSDGGFYPPFLLDPLDFGAIYAQRKADGALQRGPVQ